MTNTPIPLEARRSIVALANKQFELLEDFAFQIAMDTIADSEIPMPAEVFENEDLMETVLRDFACDILRSVTSRIHLMGMLSS